MRRHLPTIIFLLALALLAPPATTNADFTPIALGDEDSFGWAILTRDGSSMSTGILAWETLKQMKKQYGPELLVIADGDERYVITDPGLIREAQHAHEKIRDMEPEIGQLAEAQAKLSMGEATHGSRDRLERRKRVLEKAIKGAERDGEETTDLEQELFNVRVSLEVQESMERQSRLTAAEKQDLIRRRDKASERVRMGMSRINAEIRGILNRAISRDLARRVK